MLSVVRTKYAGFPSLCDENRVVKLALESDIPYFVRIGTMIAACGILVSRLSVLFAVNLVIAPASSLCLVCVVVAVNLVIRLENVSVLGTLLVKFTKSTDASADVTAGESADHVDVPPSDMVTEDVEVSVLASVQAEPPLPQPPADSSSVPTVIASSIQRKPSFVFRPPSIDDLLVSADFESCSSLASPVSVC